MFGWLVAGYLLLTQSNQSVNMSLPLCESQRYFDRMLLQNGACSKPLVNLVSRLIPDQE